MRVGTSISALFVLVGVLCGCVGYLMYEEFTHDDGTDCTPCSGGGGTSSGLTAVSTSTSNGGSSAKIVDESLVNITSQNASVVLINGASRWTIASVQQTSTDYLAAALTVDDNTTSTPSHNVMLRFSATFDVEELSSYNATVHGAVPLIFGFQMPKQVANVTTTMDPFGGQYAYTSPSENAERTLVMDNYARFVDAFGDADTFVFVDDSVYTPNGFATRTTIFFSVFQIFPINGLQ